MTQVGQQRVGEIRQGRDGMGRDQQRRAAQPGHGVGVEYDQVAEAQRDRRHRHWHGGDDAAGERAAGALATMQCVGQGRGQHGIDRARGQRDHQAGGEGAPERGIVPQLGIPLAGRAIRQQRVGPVLAKAAYHQKHDRQQQIRAIRQGNATDHSDLRIQENLP